MRLSGDMSSTSGAGDSLEVAAALLAACLRPSSVSWVSNLQGLSHSAGGAGAQECRGGGTASCHVQACEGALVAEA